MVRDRDRSAGVSAKPHLVRIGTFDQPLYVTAPPGDRRRIFVVEQPGRIRVIDRREGAGAAVPRHIRARHLGRRAGPLVDGLRPRLPAAAAASTWTSRTATATRASRSSGARAGNPNRATRGLDAADPVPAPAVFEPQRRACSCSARTGTCTSAWATAARAAIRENRAQDLNTMLGKILRIDPRAAGPSGHTSPGVEPFRGRARRPQRDLLVRAAQPVALQLRPRERRPVHRRRGPGRA